MWQGLDRKVARLARRARRDLDVETVHELRVLCRRTRATLALWGSLLPRRRTERLNRAARATMRALAGLREDDVAIAALENDETTGWLVKRLRAHRSRLARRQQPEVVRRARKLKRRLRAFEEIDLPAASGDFWRERLAEREQALRTCAADLEQADAARLHQLRIAIKRWRYGAEQAAESLPADQHPAALGALIVELRTLQDLGGQVQDASDLLARVRRQQRRQADRRGVRAAERAAGLANLAERLERQGTQTAEAFREALRRSPVVAARRPPQRALPETRGAVADA